VLLLQLSDNVLNAAVKRRLSVEGIPSVLDVDMLNNLREVIRPEPRTFFNVPVFHPQENHAVLLVCLVNHDEGGMTESTCSHLVTELFQ
jgi:hypothetical protein